MIYDAKHGTHRNPLELQKVMRHYLAFHRRARSLSSGRKSPMRSLRLGQILYFKLMTLQHGHIFSLLTRCAFCAWWCQEDGGAGVARHVEPLLPVLRRHGRSVKVTQRSNNRARRFLVCWWPILACAITSPTSANVVTYWNDVLADTVRADTTAHLGPTKVARNMAMVHAAIYDAVNSVERGYRPYHLMVAAAPGTSVEAAAAQAAYQVLMNLYPAQEAKLKAALFTSLSAVPTGFAKQAGIALGMSVGDSMVALRQNDHASDLMPYTPSDGPGKWRPTSPDFTPAYTPGWGHVTPFAMTHGAQFRPAAPPALTSTDYTVAFNQVKELGSKNSATRTAEQTQIGIFWGYDRLGMGPPTILYNQIIESIATSQRNTILENARLFALANIAMADAGIVSWDAKYEYNYWRPITAIREADSDANPNTIADLLWEPMGAPGGGIVPDFTPSFPAYTSGHAAFGAAAFRILAAFYGTDLMDFVIGSDELPGIFRSFDSFSDAAEENAQSRIYLGIHWDFDKTFGISTGNAVADYVFATELQQVREPGTLLLIALGVVTAGIGLCRRSRGDPRLAGESLGNAVSVRGD